jgi:hypothetical protein
MIRAFLDQKVLYLPTWLDSLGLEIQAAITSGVGVIPILIMIYCRFYSNIF